MEKKISDIYEEAEADITKDWNEYMEKSASVIDKYQKAYDEAVKSGDQDLIKKASDELIKKKKEQTLRNDNYKEMVDATTTQIANANQTALAYVNDQTPSVYARNYAQVGDEFDIDFQGTHGSESIRKLTNEEMVKNLITEGDIQLPKKKLSVPKDKRWNTKQINSSVLQGILSGESMDKIADRLLPIIGRNSNAAIRNARTLVTGAENRGRQDSYERLEDEGVVMKKIWLATGDERTRSWHLDMDGQEKDPSDLFIDGNGNKLKYPGDPNAEPETVYNCRCSMKTKIIGFRKADGSISYVDFEDNEESLHEREIGAEKTKRLAKQTVSKSAVVNGTDISATWQRRPDQFDFEIQDIINAQGFDGNPRVVSAEEFDKAVHKSNFIAQRTYAALDQETLDSYRNQLYHGEWYVDCSNGGCAYGKGMYSAYANNTSVTDYIKREMNGYGQRRVLEQGGGSYYIETFTLTPDAKTITPNEIIELRRSAQEKLMAEFEKRGGWDSKDAIKWASAHDTRSLDDGSFAALMGYDAILTSGIDDYAIILNRTKVIFKEP